MDGPEIPYLLPSLAEILRSLLQFTRDTAAATVDLSDQWFASRHKIARPFLFCNPVQKIHNGKVTQILHPKDHLTCYKMTPKDFAMNVFLHNQFGDPQFFSRQADMLCVPTEKLSWQVIP